jgi:hypothetical protein
MKVNSIQISLNAKRPLFPPVRLTRRWELVFSGESSNPGWKHAFFYCLKGASFTGFSRNTS